MDHYKDLLNGQLATRLHFSNSTLVKSRDILADPGGAKPKEKRHAIDPTPWSPHPDEAIENLTHLNLHHPPETKEKSKHDSSKLKALT